MTMNTNEQQQQNQLSPLELKLRRLSATLHKIHGIKEKKLNYASNFDLSFISKILSVALILMSSVLVAFLIITNEDGQKLGNLSKVAQELLIVHSATTISLLLVVVATVLSNLLLIYFIVTKRIKDIRSGVSSFIQEEEEAEEDTSELESLEALQSNNNHNHVTTIQLSEVSQEVRERRRVNESDSHRHGQQGNPTSIYTLTHFYQRVKYFYATSLLDESIDEPDVVQYIINSISNQEKQYAIIANESTCYYGEEQNVHSYQDSHVVYTS